MNKKREKEAFVGVRRVKIGENRLSPREGKSKKRLKSSFPHGGKQEIIEKHLSLTGENKKTAKTGFPPRGKTRNRRKLPFPHGGKSKND